jgi:hypothetical protein
VAHYRAYQKAVANASHIVWPTNETVIKVAAMPTLGDPRRWLCVAETDRAVYRYYVKLGDSLSSVHPAWPVDDPYRMGSMPSVERFSIPAGPAEKLVEVAAQDRRAQILLGFARFPVARVADENCLNQTLVQFADVRYTEPGAARGNFSLNVPVDCPAR